MPSLNIDFLTSLKDDYKKFNTFIETGTLCGETIFGMEPYFKNLYTIEISEKYYYLTKNKYNGDKINFILGDSSIVFKDLLSSIDTPTIFFLDGHWSSGDTGKGEKHCPLVEEITEINNNFKHDAIIIIDDYRLFGKSYRNYSMDEDWSDINKEQLVGIINKRITNIYHMDSHCSKDDRLIIHISAIAQHI
jgi:hypothetical protein